MKGNNFQLFSLEGTQHNVHKRKEKEQREEKARNIKTLVYIKWTLIVAALSLVATIIGICININH